jgi:hypothetical protein
VTEPDETMSRISVGIELGQHGERDRARQLFTEVWEQIGPHGDPFYRCALAHSMADVQDDPAEELAWDLRALAAADLITEDRARQGGVADAGAGFYPSLHLNLGEAYRQLDDLPSARRHLELGQAAARVLGDDGYGAMIKRGLDGLALRLSTDRPTDRPTD